LAIGPHGAKRGSLLGVGDRISKRRWGSQYWARWTAPSYGLPIRIAVVLHSPDKCVLPFLSRLSPPQAAEPVFRDSPDNVDYERYTWLRDGQKRRARLFAACSVANESLLCCGNGGLPGLRRPHVFETFGSPITTQFRTAFGECRWGDFLRGVTRDRSRLTRYIETFCRKRLQCGPIRACTFYEGKCLTTGVLLPVARRSFLLKAGRCGDNGGAISWIAFTLVLTHYKKRCSFRR
jgi:hypothetical protein